MIYANTLAIAITREINHPIWGDLFTRVMAGRLTEMDIYVAGELALPCPDWVRAVAGGNPDYLEGVADVAFCDFIATLMTEFDEKDGIEAVGRRIEWEPELIPHDN